MKMTDELIGKVFQMISSAGAARSKYIEAIKKIINLRKQKL